MVGMLSHKHHTIFASFVIVALLCSAFPTSAAAPETFPAGVFEQEFIITAYYSPLPDQCCYVKGSFEEDVILNGKGTNGADGTPVHPGMAAAPSIYPFKTRIVLPGLGTVTVEDRGGAIKTLENNVHRLDLWVGAGEEGLARALAFGVQRVRGTVYPKGTQQPAESMDLSALEAPLSALRPYAAQEQSLLALRPQKGETSVSVQLLQDHLKKVGYFTEKSTGKFGDKTSDALRRFQQDYDLAVNPELLDERTAAYLVAAASRSNDASPLPDIVQPGSAPSLVKNAQRTLRLLGFYRGRTNGVYDDRLRDAVVAYQKENAIVSSAQEPGAGRIGPKTRGALLLDWRKNAVSKQAETILALRRVDELMAKRGFLLHGFLDKGAKGEQVKALQRQLAALGYLGKDRVTGTFGDETRKAVLAFQLASGLVDDAQHPAAGFVGPGTKQQLRGHVRIALYRLVRASGWNVL